jgi:hypothetical protein
MAAVKVHFRLTQDEDGYPPIAVETVWAQSGPSQDEYVVDNIPFFARDATIGDTVLAIEDDGRLWFEKVTCPSRNSLVRIIFFDLSCVDRVNARLVSQGCSTEYLREYGLLAVNIPGDTSLMDVQSCLQAEAKAGNLDYEEPVLRQ